MTEEKPVRFLEAFVDHLTLTRLGFQRATPAATGRPADHPADLLQLSIDGSLSRLRSSRRLAQAPHRPGEWLWLFKQRRPDHKTMADLRQNTRRPLRQGCRACPLLCTQMKLFAGALVAIDGSKCTAVNAKERNVTQATLTQLLHQSDPRVEGYRKALDGQDNHEEAGPPGGAGADNVQAQMEALQPRQRLSAGLQAP
jgi:transposase